MAYYNGIANSLSGLLTAIQTACVTEGWTLSGNVLHKGSCYAEILHVAQNATYRDCGYLTVQAGLGIDGSNNLTGGAGAVGSIGPLGAGNNVTTQATDWDWPVTYHIHVLTAPDEVYVMVNYGAGLYWQGMSFGQSPSPGCPGTGNWHHGHCPIRPSFNNGRIRNYGDTQVVVNPAGSALSSLNGGVVPGAIPFWQYTKDESSNVLTPSQFHGTWMNDGVTTGWSHSRYNWNVSGNPSTAMNVVSASRASQPLPTYSPNAWNSEAHLIRLQIMSPRLDWKSSIVGELRHARFIRNDFLEDGQVITFGPESWKVYPAYRKDAVNRNGSGTAGAAHSGTCAIAIRYDGP